MEQTQAKNYFWVVLDLLIVAVLINLVFFVMPAIKRYGDSLYPVRSLTVSAEGKTTVSPDLAVTSFSVLSRGVNPAELADNNNQKVSAVISFVKSQNIDAKDVKTTGYSLSPDYRYDPDTQRSYITGYTLTQTVTVKIRDLSKVATVIGGLTPLGVNQIGGINFTVDDPEKFIGDARSDAFKKAQAKAQAMASANGVKLGRLVNINEYGSPVPYYAGKAMGMGGDSVAVAAPTIEPGTEDITVNVTLTYALE